MKTCVAVCCFTFFLTAFCVTDSWERQKHKDREIREYEFLLSHPELLEKLKPQMPDLYPEPKIKPADLKGRI